MALDPSQIPEVPTRKVVGETLDVLSKMSSEHIGRILEQKYPKWVRRLIYLERVRRKAGHEIWDPELGAYTRMAPPASRFWRDSSIAIGMRYANPNFTNVNISKIFPARGPKHVCRVVDCLFVHDRLTEAVEGRHTLSYDRNFGELPRGRACIEKLFVRGTGTCLSCSPDASWSSDKICVELWFWFATPAEVLRRYRYRVYLCTLRCKSCGRYAWTNINMDDFCHKAVNAFDRWTVRLEVRGWRD